jgi:hypothetical protein
VDIIFRDVVKLQFNEIDLSRKGIRERWLGDEILPLLIKKSIFTQELLPFPLIFSYQKKKKK